VNRSESPVMDSGAAARKAAAFVVRWQLLWVGLLSPLFLFPPLGRPVLLLILLLPVVWIIAVVRGLDPLPLTPLNGALALMTVMVLVSLWATFDIEFSASKVLGVVLGIAMFFAIVSAMRGSSRTEIALDLFILAGTALAIVGLLGTNWIGKVPVVGGITARLPAVIRGVPGQAEGFQPNAVAGALVMFVPLQIAFVFASRSNTTLLRRLLHLIALMIVGGTLLLTQSRSGWVALAVGLCAWAIWNSRRSRVAVLGVVLIVAVALAMSWTRLGPLLSRAAGSGIREDTAGRMELWSRAIYGIQDFPITGMGMNAFRKVMPVFYPTFLASPDTDVAHAHNHLLQAALDLGLPGLIAYLALWFGAAGLLTMSIRRSTDRDQRRIISGLAAGMIAYFVFGTADTIALGAKVGIFFWIALGLIVAVHDSTLRREASHHRDTEGTEL
jgi:putative inorganic carbon (hco3(-)) transporter